MNEKSTKEIIMLIKMINNVFRHFISIYSNYNLKDESRIEISYLIFIFKINNIERDL